MKISKSLLVLLLLFVIVLLLNSCISLNGEQAKKDLSKKFEEMVIDPDPDNPFHGTWIDIASHKYLHVINGMNGEWYILDTRMSNPSNWTFRKLDVYTIEKKDDSYITSNNWKINVNNNILAVENTTYERLVK
jgi:hypothetical protein